MGTVFICSLAGFMIVVSALAARGEDLRADRAADLRHTVAAQIERNEELRAETEELRDQIDGLRRQAAEHQPRARGAQVHEQARAAVGFRAPSLDALWARPEVTTRAALRERYGFSDVMLQRFFEPFLGGILLDRSLEASSRASEFCVRMFAEGEAVVPARGMQQIPEQIAAALPDHTVQLNTRVQHAAPGRITLEHGGTVEARAVVVATDGPELAYLLDAFDPPASRSVLCLYYAADQAPTDAPILVLDGEGSGPVNHLAVMSNVSPHYAPGGQALVSVSVIGNPSQPDTEIEGRVRAHLRRWYGDAVSTWRHLKTYRIVHAQPAQEPPTLSPPERPARLAHGLYVAGDPRTNASINGAMVAGRRAAEAVLSDLGATG